MTSEPAPVQLGKCPTCKSKDRADKRLLTFRPDKRTPHFSEPDAPRTAPQSLDHISEFCNKHDIHDEDTRADLIMLCNHFYRLHAPEPSPEPAQRKEAMKAKEFIQKFDAEKDGLWNLPELLEAYCAQVTSQRDASEGSCVRCSTNRMATMNVNKRRI